MQSSGRTFIEVSSRQEVDAGVAPALAIDHFGGWSTLRVPPR